MSYPAANKGYLLPNAFVRRGFFYCLCLSFVTHIFVFKILSDNRRYGLSEQLKATHSVVVEMTLVAEKARVTSQQASIEPNVKQQTTSAVLTKPFKANNTQPTKIHSAKMNPVSLPETVKEKLHVNKTDHQALLKQLHSAIDAKKRYPLHARRLGQTGVVQVGFQLGLNGEIQKLKVEQPSRYSSLNKAAIQAVNSISPFDLSVTPIVQARQFVVAIHFE